MMEKEVDVLDILLKVWAKRRKVIKWALMGVVVGMVVAFSIPKQYTAQIKIAPEKKSSASQLGAMASMLGVSQQTADDGLGKEIYPEIISSSPFLLEFADIKVPYRDTQITLQEYILKHQKKAWWSYLMGLPMDIVGWGVSLFSEKAPKKEFADSPGEQEHFVAVMSKAIKLTSDKKTGILTIASDFQDPKTAVIVVDSVLSKLERYMVDYATDKSSRTLAKSIALLDELQQHFYSIDSEYAATLDRNQNLISKSAQARLDRLKNERDLAYQLYSKMALQVEDNKIKVQEQTPIATLIQPALEPLRASSPKKMMTIIAFAFLFALGSVGIIVYKQLRQNS